MIWLFLLAWFFWAAVFNVSNWAYQRRKGEEPTFGEFWQNLLGIFFAPITLPIFFALGILTIKYKGKQIWPTL